MKKWMRILAIMMAMLPSFVRANEGMWLISLLNRMNEAEMKNLGLHLTPEELYSINNASLKDAIVRLNYGQCTGEIVSDKGLVFTNHHCAFDAIQTLSSVDNNMLANGFCAKSFDQELAIPNFKIQFLNRIEDVTKEVLGVVTDAMTEEERDKAIAAKNKELIGKYSENGKYEIEVKSFFYGNEFYMMVYQTFSDIRLVGNPPESVGKFGGDTDNWMWPRHTCDFSMLRVYADKDNNPAAYSKDNKPYTPKHFLPTNIDGVQEGDFAMILGFPGRTSRYLTSFGIEQSVTTRNPILIECLGTKLESWKSVMDQDAALDLMYAAKYASTANSWKYYIGQNRGLKRLDVKGAKSKSEADFTKWVNQSEDRKKKYGETLSMLQSYYTEWDPSVKASTYSGLAGFGGAEFVAFAHDLGAKIKAALAETDETKRAEALKALTVDVDAHFSEYSARVDKVVFTNLTNVHRKNITEGRPTWHQMIDTKFKGSVEAYADKLFETSVFTDKDRLMKFLEKPTMKVLERDMAYVTGNSAFEHAMAYRAKNPVAKFNKGERQYTAGLREMNQTKQYAPDANSTMRCTYGSVKDYYPADAVHYEYYTTSTGVLEKYDPTNPEFVMPTALVDLLKKKDFGRYANKKGELVTCFLANLDITGGNSGSPTIDGYGNIIGIAFDGNWEAMSGDIAFEPELQRTIIVDIRYVLFIVDKLMGGSNIINELKFVSNPKPVVQPTVAPSAPAPTTGASTNGTVPNASAQGKSNDAKQADIKARQEDMKKRQEELKAKNEEMKKKQEEMQRKMEDNKVKQEEMRKKAEEARKKAQEVNQKKAAPSTTKPAETKEVPAKPKN